MYVVAQTMIDAWSEVMFIVTFEMLWQCHSDYNTLIVHSVIIFVDVSSSGHEPCQHDETSMNRNEFTFQFVSISVGARKTSYVLLAYVLE